MKSSAKTTFTKGDMRKKKKSKKAKKEKKSDSPTMKDVLQVVAFNNKLDCMVMEDGTFMNMFQIKTKDLIGQSAQERAADTLLFDKLYKTYADDIKIIGFNYPTNTTQQQEYLEELISKTKNPLYTELLTEKKMELEVISEQFYAKEYILMIYARNAHDYQTKKVQVLQILGTRRNTLLTEITREKREEIVYKLNNKVEFL